MGVSIDPGILLSFVLVSTRLLAVFSVSPPFNGALVPNRIRVALAVSLAFTVAPQQPIVLENGLGGWSTGALIAAVIYQVAVGALLGFIVQMLMSSLQIAGAMVDFSGGLSSAAVFDPFTQTNAAPMGRLYQLIGVTLLLIMNGHLMIIRGVLRSYEAAPVSGLQVDAIARVLSQGVGQLMIAAVEISFPILVALAMTEVVLGLATRAAPKMNIMVIGFAVKAMVLVGLFGVALPLVTRAVETLLMRSLEWGIPLIGG